jgi:outer membrane receptor protein involved in Fe transport
MVRLILFLIFSIFTQATYAQDIKLSGTITDRQGTAINNATIIVKDSVGSIMTTEHSDSTGYFVIKVIPNKSFTFNVSSLSYTEYSHKFQGGNKDIAINVMLDSVVNNLDEVVITTKAPLMHRKIDRIVFNAERLNAVASNFMDILKRTPGIIVEDDDISMVNKGKVLFLLNGRELKMDMKGLISFLSSQPSDNLKQIEVMTTPPAKYSAEGNAGIINFVTKKILNNYFSSYLSNRLSIKEHLYDGISYSMQYKRNKVEAYVTVGKGLGNMQTDNKTFVYYPLETWTTTNRRLKSNNYALVTAGMDYELTENSTLGAIVTYNDMHPDADNKATTTISSTAENSSKYFDTFTDFNSKYHRTNANLHYSANHLIRKGGSVNIDVDYLNYTIHDKVDLQTTHDESLSYLNRPSTAIRIYQGKADFELPVGNTTLSFGGVYSQSKTDNQTNYEYITNDDDLNDHFVYREQIIAGYADIGYKPTDKLETKLGLRGEYGKLDGNSIKLTKRTRKYQFDLFPTAYLNYSWNDSHSLSLSVSSRINRPSYVDINPFTTYKDSHTIQSGNPKLLPEKSYTAEIGYTIGDLSLSASSMWKKNVIAEYTSIDATREITTIKTDNVMKKQMYSFDLSYYFDKIKWFDCSIDGSVYTIISKPTANYNLEKINNTAVFLYMDNNFYFNKQKTLVANLWGQYQSKEKDVAGESSSRYRIDFGLKYLLFNKKLSIGIEYQNMLASHTKSSIKSNGAIYTYNYNPYRVLNLTVSYQFGKKLNVHPKNFGISSNRL